MKKESNLTLTEANELQTALLAEGIRIPKVLPTIPVGLYTGKFVTQMVDKTNETVIDAIRYTDVNGRDCAFMLCRVNLVNTENGREFQSAGISLTDEIETLLTDKSNLVKEFDFKSVAGRKRNFIELAS